ncbi:cadmium resistance transporter [Leuconostoc lactis]|uniref:cadmium resistance transporter n=1 Tax=Leuconostoc lactis TaxID=1246 RepID=UPI0008151F5D|nr:cadmium resistance transporter [Leuconostoc lactis]ANY12394.1 hypothetical protein BCR17_08440 [Leuconostoc lactis]
MIFIISLVAFVSSNIDDMIVLTVLFAQAVDIKDRFNILIGQYIGILTLLFASYLIATFLVNGTQIPLNLLGVIPIMLSIKKMIAKNSIESHSKSTISIVQVAALTIASGADNVGIYTPIIAKQSLYETVILLIVFAVMIPVWWLIGGKIGSWEIIKVGIKKNEKIIVASIYFLIGIWIIFG